MKAMIVLTVCMASLMQIVHSASSNPFNITIGYNINVDFGTWSNFGANGGCVTCPYTCARPKISPDGSNLNYTNSTQINDLPAAYTSVQQNGCCFAAKSKSKRAPSCQESADPPKAEDCGFLSGPSLSWDIKDRKAPLEPMRAILFASIDCLNFWAVGQTPIKQDRTSKIGRIQGKKVINGGCYGDPDGAPIVLAGCITADLKFDKSKGYTWEMLGKKCRGLGGQCSRTNGLWGENLKCCRGSSTSHVHAIEGSTWDLFYEEYHKGNNLGTVLSGPAVFGIVFFGVALLMCMVHCGSKTRERARQTKLMREQETSDDYEEIITPLTSDPQPRPMQAANNANVSFTTPAPQTLDISIADADEIYRKEEPEFLYEGELH